MKRSFLSLIKTSILAVCALAVIATPVTTLAAGVNPFEKACSNASSGGAATGSGSICGAAAQDDFSKLMSNIVNTILLVLGMIAVIMIIIGGIRYTTSNGDSSQIKSAKDTILYAVVGLVIAILAYAIVNFVLASFK